MNNINSYNKGRYGGGIVMNYSGAQIKNNIIIGNSGGEDFGGGGLWFLDNGYEPLILENNMIVNNSSALGGGRIRVWFSEAIILNNIFWGNTANSLTQIQGFSAQVIYCCVEGGFTGEGNIEEDPDFIPESFVISEGFPCIDAGNADVAYYDPEDPHKIMVNIYPNPVTSIVTIEVNTDNENTFEIQICDSNSLIKRLGTIQMENKGQKNVVTDISELSPAIYFITLRSENSVGVHKVIKI